MRRRRSVRRRPAPPPPPPPQQPTTPPPAPPTQADVERARERAIKLQRALTQEVKRTRDAYLEVADAQGVVAGGVLDRYRNPHDRISEFDRLKRKDPAILTVPHFALLVPGLARRFRAVPERAVAEYAEDEDGAFALIECPCGAKPIVRRDVEKCTGCERYYSILGGKRAIVIYGAMTPPGEEPYAPEDPPSSCELGECDGSGFRYDETTNTSWDCRCRPARTSERRAARS